MDKDSLGDSCKFFENIETKKILLPEIPIYARLEGRGFSKFTKKMKFAKPYDGALSTAMIKLTEFLVKEFNAVCGYTQSDEISLAWLNSSNMPFEGKIQKICSVTASSASVFLYKNLLETFISDKNSEKISLLEKEFPTFDCRIFGVSNEKLCVSQFLWRELDCTKNAISLLAQQYFSHKELLGKTSSEKQEMLMKNFNINFNNSLPSFKRGTYCIRKTKLKTLSPEILEKIPENQRPTGPVIRNVIESKALEYPLIKIQNKADVLFRGLDPIPFEDR